MYRARMGVIARLPLALRREVNQKLDDNVPPQKIADWLRATQPELRALKSAELLAKSISVWRNNGGYAEWVRQRERLEEMKAQREIAFEIAREADGSVEAANLAIAASHIYEVLQDFDVRELKTKLQEKPELYSILLQGISRLSQAGLGERKLQLELTKYQDKVAEQKRKIEAELGKAKRGGLTPANIAKIEEALNLL